MIQTAAKKRRIPIFRSVHTRLALAFAVTVCIFSLIQFYIAVLGFKEFTSKMIQQEQWDTAAFLANELQPMTFGELDAVAISQYLYKTMVFGAGTEVYLLDAEGKIQYTYPTSINYSPDCVWLEPIRKALNDPDPDTPLRGDNPSNIRIPAIFSVAPMTIRGKPGYLYIVLEGRVREQNFRIGGQFFLTGTILFGAMIILIVTISLGLVFSKLLTRRFRTLATAVQEFGVGDFSKRAPVESEDEVGLLAETFNSMADSIVHTQELLKQRDELRRNLIADIVHDMRSPLTGLLGMLSRNLEPGRTIEQDKLKQELEIAWNCAQFQKQMVAELFELSKLEAQARLADLDSIPLQKEFAQITNQFAVIAKDKQVTLNISGTIDETLVVLADATLLTRALANLVDNAIRYTPPGGSVELSAEAAEDSVIVEVRDSGAGVSHEQAAKITERGFQADGESSGMGLGLAIVKRIAELHGSALEMISSPGAGSRFRFKLQRDV